jgi:ABC-2 type transport system ATP-binding protein
MSQYSIEVHNLTKKFGQFTAVDNISFTVKEGEVFGFLGANGAGKSTTIRLLCALLNSTSGSATVAGFDIDRQPESVKKNIGYMSQKFSLYQDLTVEENLNFFGGIYGLSNHQLRMRKDWALKMAGLEQRRYDITRELPGGWKQRLALGCAVLHQPKIVFLDEPTGGVDPLSRRQFWDLINSLSQSDCTVFVTTHYLDEAEYCGNIMLIDAGRIIAGGSPTALKVQHISNAMFEVECERVVEAMTILRNQSWSGEISLFGAYLHISLPNEIGGKEAIIKVLRDNAFKIIRIDNIAPSLEDVFLHLIEKK